MKKFFSLLLVLPVLCLLSCKRIPLYDPSSDVYLKLDISLETDVQWNKDLDLDGHPELAAKVYPELPEMVHVCFYDTESHKLAAQDYLPSEGGFIDIAPGVYDMIVYSIGMAVTQVDGTASRGSSRAFTSTPGQLFKLSKAGGAQGGEFPVIYEPDHVFVGRKEGVVIPVHEEMDHTVVIECGMSTLLETYSFEILDVVGAENIQSAAVYITGQAPSKYLWDCRYTLKPSAIYFPTVVDVQEGHIYSVFNTFGKIPGVESDAILNLNVTTVSGAKYQWIFDVTDQFDNPDNTRHEIIIDETVDVPSGGSGGFTADVHEWETEVIPITL